MANLNKVMLIGNLTRDPELRVTPKGTAICNFSLAINRKFRDESGNDREEVTYVDVEAWNKSAENIAKYSAKGRSLFVEGRLKFEQWEDKNTKEKRSRLKVVCDFFQFIGGRDDGAGQGGQGSAPAGNGGEFRAPPPRQNRPIPPPQENLDEDVPF